MKYYASIVLTATMTTGLAPLTRGGEREDAIAAIEKPE